ncbi:MAG: hypothetical protein WCI92_00615 [Bacteroidota bacterium]
MPFCRTKDTGKNYYYVEIIYRDVKKFAVFELDEIFSQDHFQAEFYDLGEKNRFQSTYYVTDGKDYFKLKLNNNEQYIIIDGSDAASINNEYFDELDGLEIINRKDYLKGMKQKMREQRFDL